MDVQSAAYQLIIVPEFCGLGVVQSTLRLKRALDPVAHSADKHDPWRDAPVSLTATVWDPESYGTAIIQFHGMVFRGPTRGALAAVPA
jgi:hypothetical protein